MASDTAMRCRASCLAIQFIGSERFEVIAYRPISASAEENVEAPGTSASTSAEDAQIRMGEAANVWKDRRQIRGVNAEPGRERRRKLVHRSCWNPATLSGVVGTVDGKGREGAEQSAALDGAAHHELVTAPSVIGAAAIRRISASEIRSGERGHILRDAQLVGRVVKRIQALAQLRKEICLAGQLIAVGVVTADRTKENLAVHAQVGPRCDQFRDHIQLLTEAAGREHRLKRRNSRKR